MARFQKGHPKLGGKQKGSKNKATIELDLLQRAARDLNGHAYWINALSRILRGRAPHLETYLLPRLHGRPVDQIELSGPGRKPLRVTIQVVHE